MIRIALTLLGLTMASGAVYANQCPTLMKQVDDALAAVDQSAGIDVADATQHRNAGDAAHTAGDHAKSIDEFNKALSTLDIKS